MRAPVRDPKAVEADLSILRTEREALARQVAEDRIRDRRSIANDAAMRRTQLAAMDAGIAALVREASLWAVGERLRAHPSIRSVRWVQEWTAMPRGLAATGIVLAIVLVDGSSHRVTVHGSVDADALEDAVVRCL